MTNAMIILGQRLSLMEEGKIGTTGRKMIFEDEDGKHEIDEPEQIHTFAAWKSLGYSVKKGEHAIAKFTIWKHVNKKAKNDDEPDEEKMFMKTACFFSPAQVEKMTA